MSGEVICRFILLQDGEWITITQEGWYNASSLGHKYMNARVGNCVYEIGQYKEDFYRPDMIRKIIDEAEGLGPDSVRGG